MNEQVKVNWPGRSGRTYTYEVYAIGSKLKAEGGNYIFTKLVSGKWSPVYIGQTANLDLRMPYHHKRDCIEQHAATHIHAHLNAIERDRLAEESDLVTNFNPVCNG